MAELPSGTVTFLFTDLQGSTRLWEADRQAMAASVARHHVLLEGAIHDHEGVTFSLMGDGVAAAFARAPDAVVAAVAAQRALTAEAWGDPGPLRARMGVHTGEGRVVGGQYESHTLNRCSRLMAGAHGGQVLISGSTAELVRGELPAGVELLDLGEHRLRDLLSSMHVFQVRAPGLASEFPPLRSLPSRSSELPAPIDGFVGRADELRDIAGRLRSTRLLTLTGPGGTGKTRLAVRAASGWPGDLDDRVCFVDLSACRDVDAFLSVTARSVGVYEQSDRLLLDAIEEQIGSRPMLLILDNFEQVVASAAVKVAELLRDCPQLRVLVTSREALNVTGEQVYPVPPLGESDALQLFVERARAVRPDFELTTENASDVTELCRRVDRLPLAIELATARLALLSPHALVERLGDRLDLLKGGALDAPERQRTLRDTIRWSFELLTDADQRLLVLLAVFSGATLEAVEAVASRVPEFDEIDVLEGLGSLVRKSLLRQVDDAAVGPRLSMLETIRAFAVEQLGAVPGRRDAAFRAHAEYFADWTLQQREKLTGHAGEAAADKMVADIENLRAAWRYWVAEANFRELGQLTDGLWPLYNARGWHQETTTVITDLLAVLASTPSREDGPLQQILLQTSLARILLASEGYTDQTERAFQRALELCEAHGELPQLLPVLRGLSPFYILYQADFAKSVEIGEQLLALADRFDDARARVEGHLVIGASEGMLGRLQPGIDHLERGIEAYNTAPRTVERFETGNDPGVVCQVVDGMLLWMQGYPDRARDRAYEAVDRAVVLNHPPSIAYANFHTGLIHLWLREPERAADHAAAVIDNADAHDFPVWTAAGRVLQGAALAAAGSVDDGLARLEAAIHQYRSLKSPPVFWPSILMLHAAALGHAGRPDDGIERIDEALQAVARLPEPQMLSSELSLLRGRLMLEHSNNAADVEHWFRRSVEEADRLGAPMLQLRATSALARFWSMHQRTEGAARVLGAAYARLTEGFATADLTDARQLLEQLAAEH